MFTDTPFQKKYGKTKQEKIEFYSKVYIECKVLSKRVNVTEFGGEPTRFEEKVLFRFQPSFDNYQLVDVPVI